MKPPETVTLINLDGTLVFPADTRYEEYMLGSILMANNHEHGWYAIEFSVDFSRQVRGLDDNANILEERDNVIFLNDQLTFIRNGMWETLAIYQATQGRYWEVPWYEPSNVFMLEQGVRYHVIDAWNEHQLAYYGVDKGLTLSPNGERVATYEPAFWTQKDFIEDEYAVGSLNSIEAYKPTVDEFLKHYPDVFSKLTPWKGE